MNKKLITLTILAGSLALTGLASAQETDTPTTDLPPGIDKPLVLPDRPEWLRDLRQQFIDQRRDQVADLIEARRLLRERLANATEEERREIIREFRQLHRERIAAERELRKEFRRQVRELRRDRRHVVDDSEG